MILRWLSYECGRKKCHHVWLWFELTNNQDSFFMRQQASSLPKDNSNCSKQGLVSLPINSPISDYIRLFHFFAWYSFQADLSRRLRLRSSCALTPSRQDKVIAKWRWRQCSLGDFTRRESASPPSDWSKLIISVVDVLAEKKWTTKLNDNKPGRTIKT